MNRGPHGLSSAPPELRAPPSHQHVDLGLTEPPVEGRARGGQDSCSPTDIRACKPARDAPSSPALTTRFRTPQFVAWESVFLRTEQQYGQAYCEVSLLPSFIRSAQNRLMGTHKLWT